jgi:hypothetical protein
LFALSQNKCAFPDCSSPLVDADGTVTGRICHIKARSPGGKRYDQSQSNTERHSFENLILLCAYHHDVIENHEETYTSEVLKNIKHKHENCERDTEVEITTEITKGANKLLSYYQMPSISKVSGSVMVNSPGAIHAQIVNIKTTKRKASFTPPAESIASILSHRNYVKHLIDRYNEFASSDPEKKTKFRYSVIYSSIQTEFGAKWDMIPLSYFNDLVSYLHKRIYNTRLGRIRKKSGEKCFSTFEEYLMKYYDKIY